ncbi:MAG: hypothetical protein N2Z72_01710, partial [Bacteroidales bacterium]|nr:hypothetical protein [Bacteroidales bacterium]
AHSGALFNAGTPSEISQVTGPGLAAHGASSGGPPRVGFSATSSTNRLTSGSSFYGVQNLGGNVYEIVWGGCNRSGNGYNLTYFDVGNGELNTTGTYDVNNWSVFDVQIWEGGGDRFYWRFELRGGAWNSSSSQLRISDRSANFDPSYPYFGYGNTSSESRWFTVGGRGVR